MSDGMMGRQQCWTRQFGEVGKGHCPVCGKTIYRNAGAESKWGWAPGSVRSPSFPGGVNPRRRSTPLCRVCSCKVRRREPEDYAALDMILYL